MQQAFKNIAHRIVDAECNFVNILRDFGEISEKEAAKVFLAYRIEGRVKLDAVGGRYSVKHGVFLDRDIIRQYAGKV